MSRDPRRLSAPARAPRPTAAVRTSRLGRSVRGAIRRLVASIGYELVPLRRSDDQFISALIRRTGTDLLVDVGANQGQYARRFRAGGFTGGIISFEPMQEAFDRLLEHSGRDVRWEARRVALARHRGIGSLRVAANSVSSSLLPMTDEHLRAAPLSQEVRTETVTVSTLDEELGGESPGANMWLKLDVQGGEMAVLEGGRHVLSRVEVVQCELSTRELYEGQASYLQILQLLEKAGFSLIRVIPVFHAPATDDLLQFDAIAVRHGHRPAIG